MSRRAEISASGFQLEASVVADTFRVSPAEIMAHIRDGRMTTRCEAGVDEDQGRHRLTFFLGNRQARFVIDASGQVLHSACIDFGDRARGRRGPQVGGKTP
jgi:hypothetical protein